MPENILTISEPVSMPGGIFEKITVSARTDFSSSVEVNELNIQTEGDMFVEGRLNAPYITVAGQLDIMDTIETERLEIEQRGWLKAGDHIVAKVVSNNGDMDIKSLRADEFTSKGRLKAKALTADTLQLKAVGESRIQYIQGDEIRITAGREHLIFKDKDAIVIADEVDGREVYVENLSADLVRGDRVTIGPGCTIKVVEYTEQYALDEAADVLELGKISRD